MDQPPLPDINPYVNRNLFSEHYLKKLPTQDESWQVDEDRLKLAMQGATNLYAGREEEWAGRNEPQLEDKLVRPMLQALGHKFEVQPSLPTAETVRRPDYAFFGTDEERLKAKRDHDGQAEYFNKAIAIGDAKRWDRSLDKKERSGRDSFDMLSPSWQIDYYLRMSGVKWGILTNGRLWRLYNQETSFRLDICYEIDLPRLLAAKDPEAFKYFYLFFRRQAFVQGAEGLCFLDRVYQRSLEYAQAVGDDLEENVYKALRLLAEGFLHTQGNNLDPVHDLDEIHANSLVLLYRLLFINYAEDRGLLPRANALYRDSYGLVAMEGEVASRLQRGDSLSPLHTTYWGKLKTLFELINRGTEGLGVDAETMDVPPYNGGLFEPEKHPFLEQHQVADKWVSQVVDLLARSQGQGVGRGFVDYSSLDVRHLGSIYEGLLEYKPRVADEGMVAVKRGGKEQWIPSSDAGGTRVLDRVEPGSIYLATDRGERKATGSYYTPDYIVKYIVEHTVGPLIEEKTKEDDPIKGILSLKVLDPAMGSGHFLVEATDRLAHALVQALGGAEQEPEEEDIRWARREVVERCIYGVDLNPLAVELAKLSLWLHTVAEGKPLNFLDHHLKVGNSLIGAWVEDLGSLPVPRKRGAAKEGEPDARQMNLFELRLGERLPVMLNRVLEIVRRRTDTLEDIKSKVAADRAMEELKEPFKAVADLWVSTYFGNDVIQTQYHEALQHIGEPQQLRALSWVKRASEIVEHEPFFHWELEFPEVFYDDTQRRQNPGFDAVVGNPPYLAFHEGTKQVREYFRQRLASATGKYDQYVLFIERGISLASPLGYEGMITPNRYLTTEYGRGLRAWIVDHCVDFTILDFADYPVFDEVTTYASIHVALRKGLGAPDCSIHYDSYDPQVHSVDRLTEVAVGRADVQAEHFAAGHALDVSAELVAVWERLNQDQRVIALSEITSGIFQGIRTGRQDLYYLQRAQADALRLERAALRIAIGNEHVRRYHIDESSASSMRLIYPYRIAGAEAYPLSSEEMPRVMSYLEPHRSALEQRRDSGRTILESDRQWWELWDPCPKWEATRIVVPDVSDHNRFAFDRAAKFAPLNIVYSIVLSSPEDGIGYEALLALLNSSVVEAFVRSVSRAQRGGYFRYQTRQMSQIPIPRIRFNTPPGERALLFRELVRLFEIAQADKALAIVSSLLTNGEQVGPLVGAPREIAAGEHSDVVHDFLGYLAEQMMDMNSKKEAEKEGFLAWLAGYTRLPIEGWGLRTVVWQFWEHPWEELQRVLHHNRKAIKEASGPSVESRETQEATRREFEKSMAKLNPLLERISWTDRLIDLIVYRLYGLTEEEIAVVEESTRE